MRNFLCAVIVLTLAIPANAVNIKEQGIFSAGGVVLSTDGTFDPVHGRFNPKGQTHHADHASDIFIRKGYGVHLVDQLRRGEYGRF